MRRVATRDWLAKEFHTRVERTLQSRLPLPFCCCSHGQTSVMSMSANLDRWLSPFNIDAVKLYRLASLFSETYKYLALNSTEQFLPTPVTSLPTGEETGKFLAIDLGGTNLRVGFLELLGSNQDGAVTSDSNGSFPGAPLASKSQGLAPPVRRSHERSWPIGEHLKMDRAEDLFDWLGDCVAEVVAASVSEEKSLGIHVSKEITMGITFSFPMMYVCTRCRLALVFRRISFFGRDCINPP